MVVATDVVKWWVVVIRNFETLSKIARHPEWKYAVQKKKSMLKFYAKFEYGSVRTWNEVLCRKVFL